MTEPTTLIRVTFSTKEALDKIGKKTDSYDAIIKKLLERKKKHNPGDVRNHEIQF